MSENARSVIRSRRQMNDREKEQTVAQSYSYTVVNNLCLKQKSILTLSVPDEGHSRNVLCTLI